MEEKKKIALRIFALGLFGFLFYFGSARAVEAATLYLSPATGSFSVGQTFSVGIYVSSADQAMNAASATVNFPTHSLEVSSVVKNGTIMNLWAVEPSFSNGSGTVNFEGIVLNPGYTGTAGKLLTVNFKALAEGEARVSIGSGAVLANDGSGTNIVSGLGSANYTIIAAAAAPPPAAVGTPAAPTVTSSTHPDQDAWYANDQPTFSWSLPAGTTGVNILADQELTTNPGTVSEGIFSSFTYQDVEDGIWYFHIRLQNSQGWGGITHLRFQIDTVPPETPVVTLLDGEITDQLQPRLTATSFDATSGVGFFLLTIDDGAALVVKPEEISADNPYVLPRLDPGDHQVAVQAVDRAGNYSQEAVEEFVVVVPVPLWCVSGPSISYFASILALTILSLALFFALLLYAWWRFWWKKRYKKMKRDARRTAVRKAPPRSGRTQ